MRVSWVSGIAFLIAFVLTFWPSRQRMTIAAALWAVGMLSFTGLTAYDLFLRGGIAYAFSSPSSDFPLFAWLVPLVSLGLAITESVLLFPQVPQDRALRVAKVLFLAVVPTFIVLTSLPYMQPGLWQFPLGMHWLGYPLLWFRIRENSK